MSDPHVVVVVLSYGLWSNKRTPKEIVGYGMYLDNCAQAIRHLDSAGFKVTVIISGGAMHDCNTEAETLLDRFVKMELPAVYKIEDQSLTSAANVWESYKVVQALIEGPWSPIYAVLFTCDKPREKKVRYLVDVWMSEAKKKVLNSTRADAISPIGQIVLAWPYPEVVAFERPDITFKSTRLFQSFEILTMKLFPRILRRQRNKTRFQSTNAH